MGSPHVSTGLGTMLLGVSGSCEDREVTSLPEELPREPDSEKETWRHQGGEVTMRLGRGRESGRPLGTSRPLEAPSGGAGQVPKRTQP